MQIKLINGAIFTKTHQQSKFRSKLANFLALITLVLIGYSNKAEAAITQITDLNKCPTKLCWEITGVITKSDLKALAIAIEIINRPTVPIVTPLFRLNSAGGDVDTAIAIGRQLRKYYATAMVWDNGGCYSSCVFIYAGAVRRMSGDSSIGIHRPYLNSTEYRDFQTIQNDQRRLEKLAKEYLLEVNVSPSLYDAMISTPPEKIRMLTQDEQQAFGLLPIDPVQQELWDSSEARRRNLTKGEYIRRKAQANITCANDYKSGQQTSNFDRYTTCYEDVLINRR